MPNRFSTLNYTPQVPKSKRERETRFNASRAKQPTLNVILTAHTTHLKEAMCASHDIIIDTLKDTQTDCKNYWVRQSARFLNSFT
ncbi:hypothetical protein [Helicobacter bizzozeronii]|uniref:hypothetical protein n=1 Tax=Helicobacter bizzozeronii TaxID=56877 RepID=UPI00131594E0|nr:hypothetical protein [Helicobacter bizzozeronii]